MTRVAVVGCGWFGLPLAKALLAAGYQVRGSKRTEAGAALLRSEGIEGITLDLEQTTAISPLLLDCQCIVINIPPRLRQGNGQYLTQLQRLLVAVADSAIRQIIFISSTGIYPQQAGVVTEAALPIGPVTKDSEPLLLAEQYVCALANAHRRVTVLRFAGLIGPGRHPGRFLAGKIGLEGRSQPVNLVHLDDCINATLALLKRATATSVYNLAAPIDVNRETFYRQAAELLGLAAPQFDPNDNRQGKRVSGELICQELDFCYRYTDPKALLLACEAAQ